jgi:hypothetical protein
MTAPDRPAPPTGGRLTRWQLLVLLALLAASTTVLGLLVRVVHALLETRP